MSDEMINYIGVGLLLVAYWYINIIRPKKLLKVPGQLQLKALMTPADKKLFKAVSYSAEGRLSVLNNVPLSALIYSSKLGAKSYFKNFVAKQFISHLIVDEDMNPVLAVEYSSASEETKLNYLGAAGIGCCVFQVEATHDEIVSQLKAALDEILNQSHAAPEVSERTAHA